MADPILLQMKYARIVEEFGKIANISWETALDFFYHSATYELIREGISDLHCHSDGYLAELLLEEYKLDDAEREKRLKALDEMTEAEFLSVEDADAVLFPENLEQLAAFLKADH